MRLTIYYTTPTVYRKPNAPNDMTKKTKTIHRESERRKKRHENRQNKNKWNKQNERHINCSMVKVNKTRIKTSKRDCTEEMSVSRFFSVYFFLVPRITFQMGESQLIPPKLDSYKFYLAFDVVVAFFLSQFCFCSAQQFQWKTKQSLIFISCSGNKQIEREKHTELSTTATTAKRLSCIRKQNWCILIWISRFCWGRRRRTGIKDARKWNIYLLVFIYFSEMKEPTFPQSNQIWANKFACSTNSGLLHSRASSLLWQREVCEKRMHFSLRFFNFMLSLLELPKRPETTDATTTTTVKNCVAKRSKWKTCSQTKRRQSREKEEEEKESKLSYINL